MLYQYKNRKYLVWNKNLKKTRYGPMIFILRFNKDSNEFEFRPKSWINCYSYSISELESMLKELKEINKEIKE